jgi:hypothetical protein
MVIGFQTDEIRRALRLPPHRAAAHADDRGSPDDRLNS